MTSHPTAHQHDPQQEIAELIGVLHATQRRLQELTGGEVDAAGNSDGGSLLLHVAQQQLRESEERFSDAFEYAPIGMGLVALDGKWLKVNRELCDLVGCSEAELLARTFQDIIHPDDLEADLERVRAMIAGEIPSYQMEKRYVPTCGHFVEVLLNVSLVRDEHGQPRYFISQIQDITERKQTEQLLRASEERFRIAAETTNDVVYEWDLKQSVGWFGNIDGLLGYRPGEFPRTLDGWASSVHPEDGERTMAALQAHVEGRAPYAIEYRVRRKDGIYRWWSARGAAARAPDGKPTRMIGSITDITERKQAVTARDRLAIIIESTTDLVGVSDVSGNVIYLNRSGRNLLGVDLDEDITKSNIADFVPNPASHRTITEGIPTAARLGIWSGEIVLHNRSGQKFPVSQVILAHKTANGEVESFSTIMRDITERKRAEADLLQSEKRFRAMFELASLGMAQTDPRTAQWLLVNQKMCEITGYSAAEMLQMHVFEITHPEDQEQDREQFDRVVRGELPDYRMEKRYLRKDGALAWVNVNMTVIRDADGRPKRTMAAIEDITGRKQAEAELEKTHRELLDSSRQIGMAEVATSVLHNVGNVLNSVNVASTLLAERLRKSKLTSLSKVADLVLHHEGDLVAFLTGDAKGRQLPGFLAKLAAHLTAERDFALRELAQLQDHIEHIKDIVNMQQGFAKVSGLTEKLFAADLVEDALKLNSSSLARHNIIVIRDYQDIPSVTLEKHKALQILVNLVRNAQQSCEEAGLAQRRLTLRITSADGRVSFFVSDNGVGIAPENLTRIFTHGFTTKQGGHGFGLHAAALAAVEMGGSLTVHSDGPGSGATFTLVLPIQ